MKFCVSLSWRALVYGLEKGALCHLTDKDNKNITTTEKAWKDFLLGKKPHPEQHEQHLLYGLSPDTFNGFKLPSNLNRYLLRAISFDIITTESHCLTYVKFGSFFILGFIYTQPKHWVGSKINVNQGEIEPTTYNIPHEFLDYIIKEAQESQQIHRKLSDKHKTRIDDDYKKNMDRASKSKTIEAMTLDIDQFGKETVFNTAHKNDE